MPAQLALRFDEVPVTDQTQARHHAIAPTLGVDLIRPRRGRLRGRRPDRPRVFPDGRHVSLVYLTEDGSAAEIGVVGYEGMVGTALFMGGGTTPSRAVTQSAGGALGRRSSGGAGGSNTRCCATRRR